MSEICPYVDICIANEDDAVGIFSMDASNTSEEKNAYIARELMKMFPFRLVASVWRTETSITTFKLQSMVYTEGKAYYSKEYYMNILDYIGAGDAYCAGIIYSILNGFDPQRMVEFSNAASCLKHTVSGDYNLVTADEVMKLAFGNAGNEVQR
jgi:2-dehydro-3-deoxygluconokinase